jgi:iron complex transport system substrate-binding protein
MYEHIEFMETVLDKEEEAKELIAFCKEKIDKVREVTSEIPDDEKPTVYFSTRGYGSGSHWGITSTTGLYDPLDLAGGINVAKGISGSTVSKEQIIAWNPDIIIIATGFGAHQAGWTDPVESALADPDFQTMDAIKNCRVYHAIYPYSYGRPQDRNLVATMHLAKLFHPEEFEDLDVEEEGNEIYEKFLGVDGLFTEYARYLYWLREGLDKQK